MTSALAADALLDVKEEAERRGARAVIAPADVGDADAVLAAADAIVADLGPIDIWINDAMVTVISPGRRWRPSRRPFR
jgi:NAD(P)-dependent dehydrogenase (short-subunit alcohol dehydrogenase family)